MSGWQEARLGDLFQIKHGFAFKSAHFSDAPGAIVLTPGNFEAAGGLKLRPGKDRSYEGEFPKAFRLKTDDLLVVMTDLTQEAAILGAPAYVPEGVACLHNQRLGKVVDLDADRLDRRFLYYVFNTHEYRERLRSTATGATVKHTSPSRIYEHVISLPPLDTQCRIAAILGAYDDLIEVNRRRVAVLEEMARGLFEEWFVRFRFPGHETVPLVDTPDGPLPQGWSFSPIGEVYDGLFDGPHATPPPSSEGAVFLGIRNVTETGRIDLTSVRHIAEQDLAKWTKRVTPQEGDIVFTYEATLNRYALIPRDFRGCLGRRMALIRCSSRPGMNRYLYHYFFTAAWREVIARNKLSGATVDRVPLTRFPEFPVVLPSTTVLRAYDAVALPIAEQIEAIEHSNRLLAATRDLLLPRLISGQLSVEAAERDLELAA